jgi:hypothetical protein
VLLYKCIVPRTARLNFLNCEISVYHSNETSSDSTSHEQSLFQWIVPVLWALIIFWYGYVRCSILYKLDDVLLSTHAYCSREMTLSAGLDLSSHNISGCKECGRKVGKSIVGTVRKKWWDFRFFLNRCFTNSLQNYFHVCMYVCMCVTDFCVQRLLHCYVLAIPIPDRNVQAKLKMLWMCNLFFYEVNRKLWRSVTSDSLASKVMANAFSYFTTSGPVYCLLSDRYRGFSLGLNWLKQ